MRPSSERAWTEAPRWSIGLFATILLAQILVRLYAPAPVASAVDLQDPPRNEVLTVAALGEPVALAYVLALKLQTYDNQPGISIPFSRLDYGKVKNWLSAMLALDPDTHYPMLMAAHLYAQVLNHPDKQRDMAEFVYQRFLESPNERWQWLAHVSIMAKHRLGDLRLAIRFADAIRDHVTKASVPAWARQMHIFLREDVGDVESARALLGGLLESGTVKDPHELRFLVEQFNRMDAESSSTPTKGQR